MLPRPPSGARKSSRGCAGRFTSEGLSSNAHAFQGAKRPVPDQAKRDHAVSPTVATRPRGMTITDGFTPMSED